MIIEKQIVTTEQVELELPAYFKEGKCYHKVVDEKTIISIYVGINYTSLTHERDSKTSVAKAVALNKIEKEEWDLAFVQSKEFINNLK